jgi:ubiquinone biosynthesis monooxygenase Coq6
LAGQGVNLGFGDVVCLTNYLRENIKQGGEIGSSIYLKKYESTRQFDVYHKVISIDLLNRLYTDEGYYRFKVPLAILRTIGLTISNRFSPLKNFYMRQASN